MPFVLAIMILATLGAALIVSGVYLLLGTGSASVAAGLFCLAAAGLMTRGLTPRG